MSSADPFKQKHSRLIRIWHWLTVLFFFASLTTVILNLTVLKTPNNADIAAEELAQDGIVITADQSRHIAHAFSDLIWNWHKFIGYGLVFLFFARMLIEALQSKEEKFLNRLKAARKLGALENGNAYKHYYWVKWSYILFYLVFFIIVVTGLGLAFEHDFSFLENRPTHRLIKNIHGFCQYFFYAYIFFHIGGVIRSDLRKHKGIVSGMINGN